MYDDKEILLELKRLSKVKNFLLFIAFPIFLSNVIYLLFYFFYTSSFSYIKVLLLIFLFSAMVVFFGQSLFFTIKDVNQIKKDLDKRLK